MAGVHKKFHLHDDLKDIAAVFGEAGKEVYLAGGAVRDMIRDKPAHDWDLATNALPAEVIAMFEARRCKVVPTGIKHGTVTVHFRGREYEVTTFRIESDYRDGRHPEKVEFARTIEEDLSRRDFTMNAVALRLPGGEVVDPFGGQKDIAAHLIRCVGNASERFGEDGLRPMRAVRFAAQTGFELDQATMDAIPGALVITASVAVERLRDELDKIIASPKPSAALLLMEKCGLLNLVLPELAVCRGVTQKGWHNFDVLDHSILACDYSALRGFSHDVRLAALLHDVGKPSVRIMGDKGVWTFYNHERVSETIAGEIMRRFRYPNAVAENVCHLIREHMFHYDDNWTDAALRRFVVRVGEQYLDRLYQLRMADKFGMAAEEPPPETLAPMVSRIDALLAQGKAFTVKDLAVDGGDLMEIGIPAGREMGIILKELLETVLDDPESNKREALLPLAANLHKRYG